MPAGTRFAIPMTLAVLLTAGCLADGEALTEEPGRAMTGPRLGEFEVTPGVDDCGRTSCFEPTVAIDAEGRVFVAHAASGPRVWTVGALPNAADVLHRSEKGGPFEAVPLPDLPQPTPSTQRGDNHVQVAPDGRLFYSSIHFHTAKLDGIQVASSKDGGRSWDTNAYITSGQTVGKALVNPDRQWLAFHDDGRIMMSFSSPFLINDTTINSQPQASYGIYYTVSDDGGSTWSDLVAAIPHQFGQTGEPRIGPDGKVYFAAASETGPLLYVASALGEPFVKRSLPTSFAKSARWFPQLALADGVVYLVWEEGGKVKVASSADDGLTWDGLRELGTEASPMGPWIEAGPDGIDVAWAKASGDGHDLLVSRIPTRSVGGEPTTRVAAAGLPGAAGSHFAFLTYDRDGRIVVPAAGPDGNILLAWEQ